MDRRTGFRKKKRNFTKVYKGQDFVESHDRQRPVETWHIEDMVLPR